MLTSRDRILTTHVGSLPRSQAVADLLFARERAEPFGPGRLRRHHDRPTSPRSSAARVEAGIDIVSDGETSKISYATYVKDRLLGLRRRQPAQAARRTSRYFPTFLERLGRSPAAPRPIPRPDVRRRSPPDRPARAREGHHQPPRRNGRPRRHPRLHERRLARHHRVFFCERLLLPHREAYLDRDRRAMLTEYQPHRRRRPRLQVDAPDLALSTRAGRHQDLRRRVPPRSPKPVEALNQRAHGIPRDRVRVHVCWGNCEGPHIYDVAMEGCCRR